MRATGIMFATALTCAAIVGCAPVDQPAGSEALMDRTFTEVELTSDLTHLTDAQREIVGLMIDASTHMHDAFWKQSWGDREALLATIDDDDLARYAEANYGPWDRLDENRPFVDGVGAKPAGAEFYPADMTKDEFEAASAESDERKAALQSLYTVVRRDDAGDLVALPYSDVYAEHLEPAAELLRRAAALAEEPGLRRYLELRADALLTNDYFESDMAWMDMKDNVLDVVIGPIETYEDGLFGYKAAFEGYVLIKDLEWSRRLERYAAFLPELQRGLPVPEPYKQEQPGTDADLNAYDVVYYAGDCNAGAKTIAINLPNDERVQLEKGTRRLQLKNAMRAKFDRILVPIAERLIVPEQRKHITFDAFFANTMFHEVAHGLGVKNTLDGAGTVRKALREQASAVEEGKADVLGLYMVVSLNDRGEGSDASLEDHFTTFMAGIFRSIRFGGASAHGRANLARFNFFREAGAFERVDGGYRVDFDATRTAMDRLSETLLRLQGDGNYDGVVTFMERYAVIGDELQADLDSLGDAGIPVDIVFTQGRDVLGLGG